MVTGWILTALILAVSGVILERGRKRNQRLLSASAATQFALSTQRGVWSVHQGVAMRQLISGHRVCVRGTSSGWEVELQGFRVASWLPLAMVRGHKPRAKAIVDDLEAFSETFVPWDEGDQVRLDRFRQLLQFVEVREALWALYNHHRIVRFASDADKVVIAMHSPAPTTTDEKFVDAATKLMTTLERALVAAQTNRDVLPHDVSAILDGQSVSEGAPTGAPFAIPSAQQRQRR